MKIVLTHLTIVILAIASTKSLFFESARSGTVRTLDSLIALDSTLIDSVDEYGSNALNYAVLSGSVETVQFLHSKGVEYLSEGGVFQPIGNQIKGSPLYNVAGLSNGKSQEVIEYLIDSCGASIMEHALERDRDTTVQVITIGDKAIDRAVEVGNLELFNYLVTKKSPLFNVHSPYQTIVRLGLENKEPSDSVAVFAMLDTLLEKGLKPFQFGGTQHLLKETGHLKTAFGKSLVVKLLATQGDTLVNACKGNPRLKDHFYFATLGLKDTALVSELIDSKIPGDVNPVTLAVQTGSPDMLEYVLDVYDEAVDTALILQIASFNRSCRDYFIRPIYDALKYLSSHNSTTLNEIYVERQKILDVLFSRDFSINLVSEKRRYPPQRTLVEAALSLSDYKLLDYLVEQKLNIETLPTVQGKGLFELYSTYLQAIDTVDKKSEMKRFRSYLDLVDTLSELSPKEKDAIILTAVIVDDTEMVSEFFTSDIISVSSSYKLSKTVKHINSDEMFQLYVKHHYDELNNAVDELSELLFKNPSQKILHNNVLGYLITTNTLRRYNLLQNTKKSHDLLATSITLNTLTDSADYEIAIHYSNRLLNQNFDSLSSAEVESMKNLLQNPVYANSFNCIIRDSSAHEDMKAWLNAHYIKSGYRGVPFDETFELFQSFLSRKTVVGSDFLSYSESYKNAFRLFGDLKSNLESTKKTSSKDTLFQSFKKTFDGVTHYITSDSAQAEWLHDLILKYREVMRIRNVPQDIRAVANQNENWRAVDSDSVNMFTFLYSENEDLLHRYFENNELDYDKSELKNLVFLIAKSMRPYHVQKTSCKILEASFTQNPRSEYLYPVLLKANFLGDSYKKLELFADLGMNISDTLSRTIFDSNKDRVKRHSIPYYNKELIDILLFGVERGLRIDSLLSFEILEIVKDENQLTELIDAGISFPYDYSVLDTSEKQTKCYPPIYFLIKNGIENEKILSEYIGKIPDINFKFEIEGRYYNASLLSLAILSQNKTAVKLLVKKRATVSNEDLFNAIALKDVSILELLQKKSPVSLQYFNDELKKRSREYRPRELVEFTAKQKDPVLLDFVLESLENIDSLDLAHAIRVSIREGNYQNVLSLRRAGAVPGKHALTSLPGGLIGDSISQLLRMPMDSLPLRKIESNEELLGVWYPVVCSSLIDFKIDPDTIPMPDSLVFDHKSIQWDNHTILYTSGDTLKLQKQGVKGINTVRYNNNELIVKTYHKPHLLRQQLWYGYETIYKRSKKRPEVEFRQYKRNASQSSSSSFITKKLKTPKIIY